MPTSRLEAFSDGVFAIAITLLIIEVRPPHSRPGALAGDLADIWPSYAAYVVSFAIIGIIWVNHHAMFDRIARVDHPLLFLNLVLLFTVAFLPFPTALLADYVRSGDNSHVAAAVYSTNMAAIGLAFLAMWSRLIGAPALLTKCFTADDARASRRRAVIGPVVYGVSIGLAFVSAVLCLVIYAGVALYFAVFYVIGTDQDEQDPSAPDGNPPRNVSSA